MPWLGLTVRSLTADERDQLKVRSGVVVDQVDPGSAADDAGIQEGDVLLEIAGERVNTVSDFNRISRKEANATQAVLFRVKRDGTTMFIAVEPGQ